MCFIPSTGWFNVSTAGCKGQCIDVLQTDKKRPTKHRSGNVFAKSTYNNNICYISTKQALKTLHPRIRAEQGENRILQSTWDGQGQRDILHMYSWVLYTLKHVCGCFKHIVKINFGFAGCGVDLQLAIFSFPCIWRFLIVFFFSSVSLKRTRKKKIIFAWGITCFYHLIIATCWHVYTCEYSGRA